MNDAMKLLCNRKIGLASLEPMSPISNKDFRLCARYRIINTLPKKGNTVPEEYIYLHYCMKYNISTRIAGKKEVNNTRIELSTF